MNNSPKAPQVRPERIKINIQEHLMDLGELTLDSIIGQEYAVLKLREFVNNIKDKIVFDSWQCPPPRGVLLTGPTGVGKTASVKAIAKALGMHVTLIELRYLDIASRWHDATIEYLREFFKTIENLSKERHVLLFIDEIEAMLPDRRKELHESTLKRIAAFLEWLNGGFSQLTGVTLIGATNCEDLMDPAVTRSGRFDLKIEYNTLDAKDIIEIFKTHIKNKKLNEKQISSSIDLSVLNPLLKKGLLNGADVPNIIDQLIRKKAEAHRRNLEAIDGYQSMNLEKQKSLVQDPEYLPEAISSEDFFDMASEFIKNKERLNSTVSIGFSHIGVKEKINEL